MTFVVYAILFVTTVVLFSVITLAGIIVSAIILDKTDIVNQNNESIDTDIAKEVVHNAFGEKFHISPCKNEKNMIKLIHAVIKRRGFLLSQCIYAKISRQKITS